MKLAVVDYGAGNLTSVLKGLRAAGADPHVTRSPSELADTGGIVIPGVGHFDATRAIGPAMREALLSSRVPLLGICLGMQLLYEGSDEAPDVPGLALIEGRIRRMQGARDQKGAAIKIPHVGWNTLDASGAPAIMRGVEAGASVYFTHGYAAPAGPDTTAVTDHGVRFASIVERGRVTGMQFHPEKSGRAGLTLLENWVAQCSASV